MATTAPPLKTSKLRQVLVKRFPGAEVPSLRREMRPGRIGGILVWPKFRGKGQLERQEELLAKLRADLTPEDLLEIGLILTVTPDEYRAFTKE